MTDFLRPSWWWESSSSPFHNLSLTTQNAIALLACTVVVICWLELTKFITAKRWWSSSVGRKAVHIITGPLFILCWNVFPYHSPSSRYFAAVIPLMISVLFALIGLGIVKDEATVKSMSRSGDRRELLRGPLSYGIIFILSAVFYWGSPVGITALMLLCAGDGFAGLLGGYFGGARLPWNSQKTWIGSVSFVIASLVFSSLMVDAFREWRWFSLPMHEFLPHLTTVTLVASIVESLPGQHDWDNVTVFLCSIVTFWLLGHQ
eukprot:TRINITY_DN3922_c1_g2_i3.p1 TRINITY_DN3922_c1_g2~~TRINITY_DN3922_c1_g2_i3.p1  ORF type:complete len:261 (+),score=-4.60 TRINITY_DN3922_c1_g2_i3:267-1049(+)